MADNTNDILLDIRNLSVAYRSGGRLAAGGARLFAADPPRRDLRPGRRKRQRQDRRWPWPLCATWARRAVITGGEISFDGTDLARAEHGADARLLGPPDQPRAAGPLLGAQPVAARGRTAGRTAAPAYEPQRRRRSGRGWSTCWKWCACPTRRASPPAIPTSSAAACSSGC